MLEPYIDLIENKYIEFLTKNFVYNFLKPDLVIYFDKFPENLKPVILKNIVKNLSYIDNIKSMVKIRFHEIAYDNNSPQKPTLSSYDVYKKLKSFEKKKLIDNYLCVFFNEDDKVKDEILNFCISIMISNPEKKSI